MNSLRILLIIVVAISAGCQKRDAVMTPKEEAEYAEMMRKASAKPKPTYEELKEKSDRLEDEAMRRARER